MLKSGPTLGITVISFGCFFAFDLSPFRACHLLTDESVQFYTELVILSGTETVVNEHVTNIGSKISAS